MCLGIPGLIISLDDADAGLATVDVSGVRRQINIACIIDDDHPPERCVGDWVLVHVGFALSRIDAAAAARTLEMLDELGETQNELDALTMTGHQEATP
ncbi:HypC/HybG/HupF family hydrogenase formation chaperone [Halomonas sp. V046]|uniref:HypC/HybG/HupF family hydrogenase formation chaperone n=1 Tax=Halomonas sp. V046 TaxID=3459611 RepID=UPI00404414F7